MELEFTKGGRGKTAPYITTHVRVPVELVPYFNQIIEGYKKALVNKYAKMNYLNLLLNPSEVEKLVQLAITIKKAKIQKKARAKDINALLELLLSYQKEEDMASDN